MRNPVVGLAIALVIALQFVSVFSASEQYQLITLNTQNAYRRKHGVPDLKLDAALSSVAQDWANQLAREHRLYRRPNNKNGEAIFWQRFGNPDATIPSKRWYSEVNQYNYDKAEFSVATNHFTQMVWRDTQLLGVGVAKGPRGATFVVANYYPQGNLAGAFKENVLRPTNSGGTTVQGSTPPQNTGVVTATTQYQTDSLNAQNALRRKHGVPDLKLDPTLNAFAQDWANQLAKEDKMYHRPNNKYGENLFYFSGGTVDAASPANVWYGEIKDYDFNKPEFSAATGHFTQLVWRETQRVGVGLAKSKSGATYVVANYDPPGNYPTPESFKENVPPPI